MSNTIVCKCDFSSRSACRGLEANWDVNGKNYCVLHCPTNDKLNQFVDTMHRKLVSDEFNFRGVYFPNDYTFQGINFSSNAYFDNAEFCCNADFSRATFSADASFRSTLFRSGATFSLATFGKKVDFTEARFCDWADFSQGTFCGEAKFFQTMFCRSANFNDAKIESYMEFSGKKLNLVFAEAALLMMQFARITKPEQVIFHTIRLRPHWFVNVDSRKFEFANVDWGGFDQTHLIWKEWATRKLKRACVAWPEYIKHGISSEALHNELQALSEIENHHRLLSNVCRQLANNAEDSKRYEEAARFHYASMDARRLERWRGWDIFTLDWWYWLMSGYGERFIRATICLFVLLFIFSCLFTQVGFELKPIASSSNISSIVIADSVVVDTKTMIAGTQPIQSPETTASQKDELPLPSICDGFNYALSAALFQRPEPKAHSFWAKLCVSLEMIFVPLQAALLALAVRRRFMR